MSEQAVQLFHRLVLMPGEVVEKEYKKLAEFDNTILAAKESQENESGFSFLILQKDDHENIIFRGTSDEFQNATTIFLLRTKLVLV